MKNELLTTNKDIENLKLLNKYKNNLMNSIGIDNFIEKVRNIIDNSENFEFRSSKSRKFINKERPIFIIKLKDSISKEYLNQNFNQEKVADKITTEVTNMIRNEITDKISEYVTNHINNDYELKKVFDSFDESMKNLCISNVYGIRNSIPDNMIYLEYLR